MNVNTPDFWEKYFRDTWEKNDGRAQTRLFAKYFLEAVRLPSGAQTLLDVGCGMGDSVPEFLAHYPRLRITGCDVSEHALEKARATYGDLARFEAWSFDRIVGRYDVIYCSNTLEHFENYIEIAQHLLRFTSSLYVLVPYMELRNGRRLAVEAGEQHVATFDKGSFDALVRRSVAAKIASKIIYTPGAWGPGPMPFLSKIKMLLRGHRIPRAPKEIIFHITGSSV